MRLDDKRAKFDKLTRSQQQKYKRWSMHVPRVGLHEANNGLGDSNPEHIGTTWRLHLGGRNRICCTIEGDVVKVLAVGAPRGR